MNGEPLGFLKDLKPETKIFHYTNILTRGGVEDTRLEAKAKDTKKFEANGQEQPFRGQGQVCPRPRTQAASVLKNKRSSKFFFRRSQKKRSLTTLFRQSPEKTVFKIFFQAVYKIWTFPKIVLSSSRGQGNFRGLEVSRPRTSKCVLEDSTSDT